MNGHNDNLYSIKIVGHQHIPTILHVPTNQDTIKKVEHHFSIAFSNQLWIGAKFCHNKILNAGFAAPNQQKTWTLAAEFYIKTNEWLDRNHFVP